MKPINKYIRMRALIVGCLFSLFFAVIGAKAVYLQIFRGPWLAKKAASQYEKSNVTYGKRGSIYDAKGNAMALSIDVPSIAAFPQQIKNARETAKGLAKTLGIQQSSFYQKLTA